MSGREARINGRRRGSGGDLEEGMVETRKKLRCERARGGFRTLICTPLAVKSYRSHAIFPTAHITPQNGFPEERDNRLSNTLAIPKESQARPTSMRYYGR